MSGSAATANPFDQFDPPAASVAAQAAPSPAAPTPAIGAQPTPVAQPVQQASTAPAASQASQGNPFDQFDPPQPAPGRDALGGYLLPPSSNDNAATAAQPDGPLARLDNVVTRVGNAATLGGLKYADAAETALEQPIFHGGSDAPTFGQRYTENLAAERARQASIPSAVAIPLDLIGTGATIASGAPAAIAKGVGAVAGAIPGVNALASLGSDAVQPVANLLSNIPGTSYVLPAAKVAAEGAGYGGVQGFNDGQGNLSSHLQSAALGAGTGAVLGPVVAGAGSLIRKGLTAAGDVLSASGLGSKVPIVDAAGRPMLGSDGQPVTTTPGVAQAAGQQISGAATDLPAVKASLANQPPPLIPGDQPTTFQATGDIGLGQKELQIRNTPGSSQQFIQRTADQNAARVQAITGAVPADASSADLQNNLTQQQAQLAAQRDAATAQAVQGTLQTVGGVADSTPTQAGADIRGAIDQARAPAVQVADNAVHLGQQQAAQAAAALGGVPAGDARTALQQFGQQFRSALDGAATDSKANATKLYAAVDPDGTLAVNMQPVRSAGQQIIAALPQNAAPLAGEEKAIFDTVAALPDAQSYRELGALNSRVTTAMRAARTDPAQAQTYARLSQLRGGLADVLTSTAQDQAASDASAVQAGTMAPEDAIAAKWAASLQNDQLQWRSSQAPRLDSTGTLGGDVQAGSGEIAAAGTGRLPGRPGATGQAARGYSSPASYSNVQSGSLLVPNLDDAAAARINAANSAYTEHKATYGAKAPGVGAVLAPGQTAGTFKLADSAVPPAIFSRGAGAAERVQASLRAGLQPGQIADYAAFDLRKAAQQPDGTLDPAAFAKWRQQNAEGLQALTQADPTIGHAFDTAQSAAGRLQALQQQRAALDATHPLKPGWGDAEVAQRVWQAGPRGADSVRAALSAAQNDPAARAALADYAAYSLRKTAAPNGVLDPVKYATWARTYDGALSAAPDIKAQFDTAASAQQSLDHAAEQHALALRDFQSGVARHFLGGADPADRVGQILNSATRVRDMTDLAELTKSDPAAQAGIQRAVVDHIFGRLQGNALAGTTGTEKLKSDQFQSFINRADQALEKVMTPQQVETLQAVAKTLQRDNQSVDGTRVAGGSDTAQKAALLAQGGKGSLLGWLRDNAMSGGLTLAGYLKGGPIGGFLANKGGALLTNMRTAGIRQTDDLVKEAMLNPSLARVLLAKIDEQSGPNITSALASQIGKVAAARSGHVAVRVSQALQAAAPPSAPQNALAFLPSSAGASSPSNSLSSLAAR